MITKADMASDFGGQNGVRIATAVRHAITLSFEQDNARKTRAEIRRRVEICWKIVKMLRYDLMWGITRISDHLAQYLRAELDGDTWEPSDRRCWIPSDN